MITHWGPLFPQGLQGRRRVPQVDRMMPSNLGNTVTGVLFGDEGRRNWGDNLHEVGRARWLNPS